MKFKSSLILCAPWRNCLLFETTSWIYRNIFMLWSVLHTALHTNWMQNFIKVWQLLTTIFFNTGSIFYKMMCQVSDVQILPRFNFSRHPSFTSTIFVMYLHTKVHISSPWQKRWIARLWPFPIIGSIRVFHVENTLKVHMWDDTKLSVCCLVYTVCLYLIVYIA
jgi:hypothetical protein